MTIFNQQKIMDHFRNPRNYGTLEHPNFSSGEYNPSCGDAITIQGIMQDNRIIRVAFTGKGCVMSQAAASILLEHVLGKTIDEIEAFDANTMQDLLGIVLGPVRLKCAMLAVQALKKGLNHA